MLYKRWQSACHIRQSVGVCKPPEGALYKRQGAERSGKRYPKGYQVRLKKLNANEPLMRCRKAILLTKLLAAFTNRKTVTRTLILVTGQPAVRRQDLYSGFYTERERLSDDALKGLCGICRETETV